MNARLASFDGRGTFIDSVERDTQSNHVRVGFRGKKPVEFFIDGDKNQRHIGCTNLRQPFVSDSRAQNLRKDCGLAFTAFATEK